MKKSLSTKLMYSFMALIATIVIGVTIGMSFLITDYFFEEKETTKGGFLWGAKGGIVYLLNSNIGLDLGAGYNSLTVKQTVDNVEIKTIANTFGVSAGVSLFFK